MTRSTILLLATGLSMGCARAPRPVQSPAVAGAVDPVNTAAQVPPQDASAAPPAERDCGCVCFDDGTCVETACVDE